MIDKKEAKSAYKLQEKLGAVVAYKNISKKVLSGYSARFTWFEKSL